MLLQMMQHLVDTGSTGIRRVVGFLFLLIELGAPIEAIVNLTGTENGRLRLHAFLLLLLLC